MKFNMTTLAYPATFKRDEDNRVVVSFPDFPTARTDGADPTESAAEAADCLASAIAFAMSDKTEIPKPSPAKRGQKLIPVPLWISGKLALYWAIRDARISQSELARRLCVRETEVRRMLNPNHESRQEKIHAALAILGKQVILTYCDAA